MTVGLSTANLANKILDHLRGGTTWTAPTGIWAKLHTGDPGSAGTSNASATTTREEVVFSAASGGQITISTGGAWPSSAGTETITHVSFWSAVSGGLFLWSDDVEASLSVGIGDPILLDGCTFSLGSLAA